MKTLVLYVFHNINERVQYFLDNCIFHDENVDFIVISNDKNNKFTVPEYVKILFRDNIGYDFGGWSEALLTNDLYLNYDRFIFANSSIIGPFLEDSFQGKWTDIYLNGLQNNIKLFGSTINTLLDPLYKSHVQSYIFAIDKEALDYLIHCEIFSTTNYAITFDDAIWNKEVLMSRKIIENGWNIGSLFKYYDGVDFTFKNKAVNEYNIQFLNDKMYKEHINTLWNLTDIVFIKGNRIHGIYPKNKTLLSELIDNSLTDKNTTHSYLELYERLLNKKKETAQNVLEIGIGDFGEKNGGSVLLWKKYFKNATIYSIDILPISRVIDELINDPRIKLYTETDGYNIDFFQNTFLNQGLKFDFMLDDGPHTLESMIQFITLYSQVLTDDGILIIEDVQSMDWIHDLENAVPENLKQYINVYDLRGNKNRYDDIVFTIDKSNI
jgi:hypothetical protein